MANEKKKEQGLCQYPMLKLLDTENKRENDIFSPELYFAALNKMADDMIKKYVQGELSHDFLYAGLEAINDAKKNTTDPLAAYDLKLLYDRVVRETGLE